VTVVRVSALVLNTLLPGMGLLLRRPGWLPALPACLGIAGLTLLAIALLTAGLAFTIPLGWVGLGFYVVAALLGGALWFDAERPSSRDLATIQPLFRALAEHYLRNELPQAEQLARRLTGLASGEAGAWRLRGMIYRAQGLKRQAERAEKHAQRLDQVGG
jgi:hypothetical protein